jgi:putative ABC transport system ATP-binding protein
VIEMHGVGRDYVVGGRAVHALRAVDLEIPDGEYVSIMGPSGSGKSTLLNIIGCLDRPSSGTYVLDGQAVGSLDDRALAAIRGRRIGFVFQVFHLVPRLTAAANVELPMLLAGIDPAVRANRVARALEAVGLSERARHKPEQLSGGERQRVAIARAIVMGPGVLLADEPTGNLDRASGAEVVALLEAMNGQGLTLVVVTHDPALGERARVRLRMVDGALT